MSHIVEQAGGIATTGKQRVLELQPKKIHERCPVYLGCTRDVEKILEFLREEEKAAAAGSGSA
jgi:fructose-1,6-bisphosphatase I